MKKRRSAQKRLAQAPVDAPRVEATNEGQRLLLAETASLAAVAKAVGCGKAIVGYWRQGTKLPSDAARLRLRDLYKIPVDAWDRLGAHADVVEEVTISPAGSTLDAAERQLHKLYRDQNAKGLSATARAKIADNIQKQTALVARLEESRDRRDDQIVKAHPGWKRIEGLLEWLGERLPKELADDFEKRLEGLAS